MAKLNNLDLTTGRNGNREIARVIGSLEFTPREVEMNLSYRLFVGLTEIDGDKDMYHFYTNGLNSIRRNMKEPFRSEVILDKRSVNGPSFDRDDWIAELINEIVQPLGSTVVTFDRTGGVEVGDQEDGDEQYRALALVVPEISHGFMWSQETVANLGEDPRWVRQLQGEFGYWPQRFFSERAQSTPRSVPESSPGIRQREDAENVRVLCVSAPLRLHLLSQTAVSPTVTSTRTIYSSGVTSSWHVTLERCIGDMTPPNPPQRRGVAEKNSDN